MPDLRTLLENAIASASRKGIGPARPPKPIGDVDLLCGGFITDTTFLQADLPKEQRDSDGYTFIALLLRALKEGDTEAAIYAAAYGAWSVAHASAAYERRSKGRAEGRGGRPSGIPPEQLEILREESQRLRAEGCSSDLEVARELAIERPGLIRRGNKPYSTDRLAKIIGELRREDRISELMEHRYAKAISADGRPGIDLSCVCSGCPLCDELDRLAQKRPSL